MTITKIFFFFLMVLGAGLLQLWVAATTLFYKNVPFNLYVKHTKMPGNKLIRSTGADELLPFPRYTQTSLRACFKRYSE